MELLAKYLEKNNMRPSHLADKIGAPASTIHRIVKDGRELTLELAVRIAGATDLKVKDLRPDIAAVFRKEFEEEKRRR